MKTGLTRTARSSTAHRLKLVCLALACALAAMLFFTRQQQATNAEGRGEEQASAFSSSIGALAVNQQPELGPVRFTRVGVGQRIFFGLSVIDEESDDVRVELIQKPASAKYNEKTLTVDWTPRAQDGRTGQFVVRITEYTRVAGQPSRTVLKTFNIAIEPHSVPLPEVPIAPLAVETLVSITDPERLISANAQWPIQALFDQVAAIEASKQIKPGSNDVLPTNGANLFRDALKNLAALHHNEEIDPDSPKFNKQWNAENWRLVMVRPRLNKKVFELRLVYRNVVVAEPVYLMPRMRIVRAKDFFMAQHKEVRLKNNERFARLFHDTFFDGPDLKPFVARDKRAYGEALAIFMTKVITYNDPTDPVMQANFAALPHNARLGGDDKLDAKGNYLTGNGWALGVMKVVPNKDRGGRLGFANLPIDGFATSIKPNGAGDAYAPFPAPRFNPKSSSFVPGWDKLIDADDLANVAIPDEHDPPAASIIDASSVSRPYKERYMVEETALRDPRRRLFEERGMTCIQCHVRNFDEGDYMDRAVSDPKQGGRFTSTRDIPRLFFVITPDDGRSEFLRRNEEEQVGNLKGVMRDFLKININLESPLASDWPFDTRRGRS